MKLVASMIVKSQTEMGRYLQPCVDHLLDFCDVIAFMPDNGSTGRMPTGSTADRRSRIVGRMNEGPTLFEHEGAARQALLDFTLALEPTHILAIDADEFVSNGAAVRAACESGADVYSLEMLEVWKASDDCVCVRGDGGWRPHQVHALWRVPADRSRLRIADRALACGRVPEIVDQTRAVPTGAQIFHFGWANEAERAARHHRYAVADGGRFHRSDHLDSIMWPDDRVALAGFDWPVGLAAVKGAILDKVTSEMSPS